MTMPSRLLLCALAIGCSGEAPSKVSGAPTTPPDEQFRLGVEAGDDVLVWRCTQGQHVVMHRSTSAFFGAGRWVIERSACGTTAALENIPSTSRHALPAGQGWP